MLVRAESFPGFLEAWKPFFETSVGTCYIGAIVSNTFVLLFVPIVVDPDPGPVESA